MSKKLTPEFIAMRTKCDRLESIKNLNLWGNDLEDVSVLKQMFNLEVVSLSVNKIRTLKHFSSLRSLRELYLRKNSISDIGEIKHLVSLLNLRTVWLSENPVADTKNYRAIVIKLLPQITKLDDTVISKEERQKPYAEDCEVEDQDQEEDDLSKDCQTEENVFEMNNFNTDVKRERERDKLKEIVNQNDSFNSKDNSTTNNEIYSNNDRNKKIKGKFVGYSGSNLNQVPHKDNVAYGKRPSNNYDDTVQNLERINLNKNKKIPTAYEASVDNPYDNLNKKVVTSQNQNIKNSINNNVNSIPSSNNNLNPSGSNLLNCVLMLLRELNDNELEIVKEEIEKKISNY